MLQEWLNKDLRATGTAPTDDHSENQLGTHKLATDIFMFILYNGVVIFSVTDRNVVEVYLLHNSSDGVHEFVQRKRVYSHFYLCTTMFCFCMLDLLTKYCQGTCYNRRCSFL